MAEAVAAVSLVSAIVSLVEFGSKLVKRISAFDTQLNEVPAVFRSLKTQLPLMTDNLQRTQRHLETGAISKETALALKPVIDSCMEEFEAIEIILDKIIPPKSAPRSDRWVKAVKSLTYEKEIERRTEVLNKNILSLLHYHATSTADINSKLLAFALEQRLNLGSAGMSNTSVIPDLNRGQETFPSLLHQHTNLGDQALEAHQKMTQAELDKEVTLIADWIDAVDTTENFQDALIARATDTCNWIFQNPTFVAWSSSNTASDSSKALWIHGPPGFGKSVLCASIIQELCERTTGSVVHFFCAAEDELKRQAYGILRSWVLQLIQKQTMSVDIARQAYRQRTALKATEPELWNLFETIGLKSGNCIFVVDGFDECDMRNSNSKLHLPDYKISFLRRLLESSTKFNFQLLLVSRYDSSIQSLWTVGINSTSTVFYEYEISREDTFDDVNKFSALVVDQQLSNKRDSDRAELTKDIVQRSDGMFLWVRLLQQRLSPGKNLKQLRTIVSETPSDIGKMYARELERMMKLDEEDRSRAIAILRWTLFATRPLTVQEMTEALLVDINPGYPPNNDFPSDALPDDYDEHYVNDRIQRLCGPIICLRPGEQRDSVATRTIHFVHFSAQEFMLTVPAHNLEPSSGAIFCDTTSEHGILARACICYLFYNEFADVDPHSGELEALLQKFHFLDYAAKFWSDHVSQSSTSDKDLHDILSFFFESELNCVDLDEDEWERRSILGVWNLWPRVFEDIYDETPSPLYYASLFGLVEIAKGLISEDLQLDQTCGKYSFALKAAAVNHHEKIVRLLLEHGATIDLCYGEFGSALIATVAHGTAERSEMITRLLIEKGADILRKDASGRTALHYAAMKDKTNIIELLLEAGASAESTDRKGATALHWAAHEGSQRAVSLLLSKSSTSNKRQNDNLTPLHSAVMGGQLSVMAMLLDNGADVNACAENGATPLHGAAYWGHLMCAELLLDHGADIEATRDKKTVLCEAAAKGNDEIVRLLLDRGANCQSTSGGEGALRDAACYGHVRIVRMLLDAGANIAAIDANGFTALHEAAYYGHVEVVELLLNSGANIATADAHGNTALHGAAYYGHVKVIETLLDRGADLEAEASNGIRPLHYGVYHEGAFNTLLKRGAKQNTTTKKGANVLHIAALLGEESIVRRILDMDADMSTMAQKGWTAVFPTAVPKNRATRNVFSHVAPQITSLLKDMEDQDETALNVAARFGHAQVVSLLFDSWFTSSAAKTEGIGALLLAAAKGYVDVVEILLKCGLDSIEHVNTRSLPLYLAAISGHEKIVEILLQHGMEIQVDAGHIQKAFLGAAYAGYSGIVRVLYSHGADVNATDEHNRTALHDASRNGDKILVDALLKFGADPNGQTLAGLTPLHEAVASGNIEVIRAILSVGPNLQIPDRYGRTCLDWIALHPPTRSRMLDCYAEYNPTDEATRTEILRTTLRDTVGGLEDGESEYNVLGHCLVFLGELQEACTAFEQEIETARGTSIMTHFVMCDRCDLNDIKYISGDRYVCMTCPDFDLCKRCKIQYDIQKRNEMDMCQGHEFLKVPGKDWPQLPEGQVNSRGESEKQWLQRLKTMAQ